jgi:nucleotide-binding universal stress UspA family protein
MSVEHSPILVGAAGVPAFQHVLCGIDGSRTAVEAARQAITLAHPGGSVLFLAVTHSTGMGLNETSALSSRRAGVALAQAAHFAELAGVDASVQTVCSEHPAAVLLEAAGEHDLLAVASHHFSRVGGILLGSTATAVVHRSPVSVLVARFPGRGRHFPDLVLLATDGSPESAAAADRAGRVAAACGTEVRVLAVEDNGSSRVAVAHDTVEVMTHTGREPVVLVEPGVAHRVIAQIAERDAASLVVVGSRRLAGVAALGSVSERVAHEAPCSVLVVRNQPAS